MSGNRDSEVVDVAHELAGLVAGLRAAGDSDEHDPVLKRLRQIDRRRAEIRRCAWRPHDLVAQLVSDVDWMRNTIYRLREQAMEQNPLMRRDSDGSLWVEVKDGAP